MKKFYVYMVQCSDNTIYTGYTTDVPKRIKTHNDGKGAKYTRSRRPVTLLLTVECNNRSEAMKEEARIKKMTRAEKEWFVLRVNLRS